MDGKVIVITGGASGMGLATAKLLASKGAKVSIGDIQGAAVEKAVADIKASGGNIIGTVVDVTKRDQCEAWIKKTVDEFGKLDGAANLAGVIGKQNNSALIEEIDDADWDFIFGVNIKGLMNTMRAEIPHFNAGGAIVNAASVAGIVGFAKNAPYSASKHAVVGLTKSAAKELGPRNIRCNAFCPGPIETPMFRKSAEIRGNEMPLDFISLKRKGEPEEVATLVEFLLGSGSSFMTGNIINIDGGWIC